MTQVQEATTDRLAPQLGVEELHPLLAAHATACGRHPNCAGRLTHELGSALALVSSAIARGHISRGQLVDLRRRRTAMEKQANA